MIKFIMVDSEEDGISALLSQKGDVYMGWLGPISHFIQKNMYSNFKIAFVQISEEAKFRLGVHKSKPMLAQILDKVIASITSELL